MAPLRLTPSDLIAVAAILLVTAIVAMLLFAYVGWFGLGPPGSFRARRFGAYGTLPRPCRRHRRHDGAPGPGAAASDDSPEARMRAAANRSKRSGILYLVNTVCIALVIVGFGMFVLHQL